MAKANLVPVTGHRNPTPRATNEIFVPGSADEGRFVLMYETPSGQLVKLKYAAGWHDSPRAVTADWEPRQQSFLSRHERERVAAIVDKLIGLLDATEPDDESTPVYPGDPQFLPPPVEWLNSDARYLSGLDTDSEDCAEDDEAEPEEANGDEEEPSVCNLG